MSLGGSIEGGGGSINNLGGVDITSPTNGQYFVYDASSGNWINSNGGGATGYVTIQAQGTPAVQETTLNFASAVFTATDNPGNFSTDITIPLTLGGHFTTSGAYNITLTATANTSVTLPTSGTLITSSVTSLPDLIEVSTITTGVWEGTKVSPTYGGTGISNPTAHGILIAEGSAAFTPIVLSAGEVLIGTTSGDPAGANLTAGTGINIDSTSGSIVVTNTAPGSGFNWVVYDTDQTLAPLNGYFVGSVSPLTFALPTTSAVGDTYQINSLLGGFVVSIGSGQSITDFLSTASTSVTSNDATGDWITLVCSVANTSWVMYTNSGSVTLV